MVKRNTDAMVNFKRRQSEDKKAAVLELLKTMIENEVPIYKSEICKKANVSKTFLYSYENELIKPIDEAIAMYNHTQRFKAVENPKMPSDKSKDTLIESQKRHIEKLHTRIKKLEKELDEKITENELLIGKLSDKK